MDDYFKEPTKVSPKVLFSPKKGILEIKGRSSPENPVKFYEPLNELLDIFIQNGSDSLVVNLELDYFNTSSSKCLYEILKRVYTMVSMGKELKINWFYEEDDEDILEAGEDLASVLGCEFNYIDLSTDQHKN